jgi:hypothetical protein
MARRNTMDMVWVLTVGATSFFLFSAEALGTVADELRFETSDFMKDRAYRHPERVATHVSPSGAQGGINIQWDQSHQGPWYIEEQRFGENAVCAGIAQQDNTAIERGLKVLHWGFEQQGPDGSFQCRDAFHSTSFFVEASAHACLLLSASAFAEHYAEEIAWMRPRILKAALWMAQPEVESRGRTHNGPYTHRSYLVAAAFGEAGVLCGNRFLIDKSMDYIRAGISRQNPSGFNPEKGGYDCSYHAVGLVFAERYYDIVAEGELKQALYGMLERANSWLESRVRPDGTIDATGNTRTGLAQEKSRAGKTKKVSYGQTLRAFYHWYLISGDTTFKTVANTVATGEATYRRELRDRDNANDAGPAPSGSL